MYEKFRTESKIK